VFEVSEPFVELQHVYVAAPEEAELLAVGLLGYQLAQSRWRHGGGLRDHRDLHQGVGRGGWLSRPLTAHHRLHFLFIPPGAPFTSCSRRRAQPERMADFLVVLGIVLFALAMLGLVWALDRV